MHSKFARVIIDRAIRRELDYAVPELLSERVSVGARVRVPFRHKNALATVVALLEQTNAKGVREIEALIGEGPTLSEPLPDRNSHAQFVTASHSQGGSRLEKTAICRARRRAVTGDDRDATATGAAPG